MAQLTPIKVKREVYSDFTMDMFRNPVSNDLARRTNENAVKEAVKNLILTDRGERPFQPFLGSDVRKLLFENYMPATSRIVKEKIENVITLYEPRAELLDVSVLSYPDRNAVQITITFSIDIVENPITFNVIIDRLR